MIEYMTCRKCNRVSSELRSFDRANWLCAQCRAEEENPMKTEDQIKDIIHGAEQRIRDIAERERQWFESGFASKMEDALSRVRAQLTAPDPGVVHGQKPALVLCHAIKTYKSDEPRRISVVELRTSYGPNYQLDFSSARLHDDDEPTPIKPGKRYLVSIAFYELPGDEP